MWIKQIMARAIRIKKGNWGGGVTTHFSEKIELKFGENEIAIHSHL